MAKLTEQYDLTKEQIANAKPVLDVLLKVLRNDLESSYNASTMKTSYDKAGWPYYQADLNGEQRAIKALITRVQQFKEITNA